MIRHLITWNFRTDLLPAQRVEKGRQIKDLLEGLIGKIPGAISLEVRLNPMNSSNRDVLLDSTFANEEALSAYQTHPLHMEASALIGTVLQDRTCFDFEF